MNAENDNNLKQEILNKIKEGQVTVHSKAYLNFRSVLWILAIAILALAGIFIGSFVVFALQASGVWDLPRFGVHGLQEFLTYFPWLFVPAAVLFIWLLERVILRHSPAYRIPVFYSALGLIAFVSLASFAVSLSPLHHNLYESAQDDKLPIAGSLYKFFGQAHPDDFYVGGITAQTVKGYNLITREGQPVNVVVDKETNFYNPAPLKIGDDVEVIGEESGNDVIASNIKKVDPASVFPLRHYKILNDHKKIINHPNSKD